MVETADSTVCVLLVRARARTCAVPIECVSETMRPLPVAPIVNAPHHVPGVAIIRGTPTPVIDLAMLLGASAPGPVTRFVTIRVGTRNVALAVDSVLGVRALDASALHPLPPVLGPESARIADAIGTHDAELLVILRGARVLADTLADTSLAVPEGE